MYKDKMVNLENKENYFIFYPIVLSLLIYYNQYINNYILIN
jgi:hypothetical protein